MDREDILVGHVIRIESRVDEVYDRVSAIQSDVNGLKWKVAAISSGVSSLLTATIGLVMKYGNFFQ